MNYPKIVETVSLGSCTLGARTSYTIRRRRLWLEAIYVRAWVTTGSTTITSQTGNRLMDLFRNIELQIHDGSPRSFCRAGSAALVEMAQRDGAMVDSETLWHIGRSIVNSATLCMTVPIYIRPPHMEDPMGGYLALPLPNLNEEPVLHLDLVASADIAPTGGAAAITGVRIELEFHFRDILAANPLYFPSEIIENLKVWQGGEQDFELPGTGFLCSVLAQNYSAANARGSALSDTTTYADTWSIYYGSKVVHRGSVWGLARSSEMFAGQNYPRNPSPTVDGNWPYWASWYRDFLRDTPDSGAFNAASALNLNTIALGGDKCRIVGSNTVANAQTKFTHRKLLATDLSKLIAI